LHEIALHAEVCQILHGFVVQVEEWIEVLAHELVEDARLSNVIKDCCRICLTVIVDDAFAGGCDVAVIHYEIEVHPKVLIIGIVLQSVAAALQIGAQPRCIADPRQLRFQRLWDVLC
jgi:hypothetical protein